MLKERGRDIGEILVKALAALKCYNIFKLSVSKLNLLDRNVPCVNNQCIFTDNYKCKCILILAVCISLCLRDIFDEH